MSLSEYSRWIWAGLAGQEGIGDTPLPAGRWLRPVEIELAEDAVEWRWQPGKELPALVEPTHELLDEFLMLQDATDDEILSFAQRWGVLEICEHGYFSAAPDACLTRDPRAEWIARTVREPLAIWRSVVARFRGTLNVAAALQLGDVPDIGLWELASPDGARHLTYVREQEWWTLHAERMQLAEDIDEWIRIGGVRPSFRYNLETETIDVELHPGALLGALSTQLAFAVARTDGLATCAACGSPFVPKRRPVAGRRTYCPTCGIKAAQRDASRAYRARARKKGAQ